VGAPVTRQDQLNLIRRTIVAIPVDYWMRDCPTSVVAIDTKFVLRGYVDGKIVVLTSSGGPGTPEFETALNGVAMGICRVIERSDLAREPTFDIPHDSIVGRLVAKDWANVGCTLSVISCTCTELERDTYCPVGLRIGNHPVGRNIRTDEGQEPQ